MVEAIFHTTHMNTTASVSRYFFCFSWLLLKGFEVDFVYCCSVYFTILYEPVDKSSVWNCKPKLLNIPSVLWHCWLGDRQGIQPVKRWILVCWWWFNWSFARLIAPVVTTTSVILSCNKIQNGDILVLANPGSPGKWPLKRREKLKWVTELTEEPCIHTQTENWECFDEDVFSLY